MVDVNVRQDVIKKLKPLLPKKWLIKPFNDLPDEVTTTSVVLSLQRYTRTKAAPRTSRTATFILTIVTPLTIPGPADDGLDDDVMDLLNAIDAVADTNLTWSSAERGVASGRPGFDITLDYPFNLVLTEQEPT